MGLLPYAPPAGTKPASVARNAATILAKALLFSRQLTTEHFLAERGGTQDSMLSHAAHSTRVVYKH